MADTRIFRITRKNGTVEYGTRRVLAGIMGHGKKVIKVEATNAEATQGWTDVTREFLGHGRTLFEVLCDPQGEPGDC